MGSWPSALSRAFPLKTEEGITLALALRMSCAFRVAAVVLYDALHITRVTVVAVLSPAPYVYFYLVRLSRLLVVQEEAAHADTRQQKDALAKELEEATSMLKVRTNRVTLSANKCMFRPLRFIPAAPRGSRKKNAFRVSSTLDRISRVPIIRVCLHRAVRLERNISPKQGEQAFTSSAPVARLPFRT